MRRTAWLGSLLFSVFVGCSGGTAGSNEQLPSTTGDAGGGDTFATATDQDSGYDDPQFASDARPLGPPYPIVLAHGFFGFQDFAGLNFINYFYGVKDDLAKHGETMVYTPAVDPFNSSEYRGAQLADAVKQIIDTTGYPKVVIIGHSQGGLDARVVAHDHPDWVAAVVTVGTPHGGVPVADIALKLVSDPRFADIVDALTKVIGAPIYDKVGNQTSMAKALQQFATATMKDFNAKYPNAFGIPYWSIAGRTNYKPASVDDCKPDVAVNLVSRWNSYVDPTDPLLSLFETVNEGFDGHVNDGMVGAHEAHWGTFLGCVPADHLDEMGQLLGDAPGGMNKFDHLAFYEDVVKFVRSNGY